MIPSKPKNARPSKNTLSALVGNLTLLYIKSRNYHWNTSGPSFYGDHHTYDGIQEGALSWVDTIGERIRALQQNICACAGAYLDDAWFPEGDFELSSDGMKSDMVKTLDCISDHLMSMIKSNDFDEVTSNMLQDLCAFIDKQNYFVRSSL